MTLTFEIENISEKEADDLALGVLLYLYEVHEIQVSDYSVHN